MSKKRLQIEAITNELAGSSLYFQPPPKHTENKLKVAASPTLPKSTTALKSLNKNDRLIEHASVHASKQESILVTQGGESAIMHERMHDNQESDYIETVRKSVKKVGREELYVRVTPEEKDELRNIVYQFNELYRRQGGKTSENEVTRIALRFLLEDHKKKGQQSFLSIIEEALNA